MPKADCSIAKEAKGDSAGVLKMAGYEEITDDEERWVMDKTKCTERDLMCEFTLQVVTPRPRRRATRGGSCSCTPRTPSSPWWANTGSRAGSNRPISSGSGARSARRASNSGLASQPIYGRGPGSITAKAEVKKSVDERSHGRGLREQDQRAQQQQDDEDRGYPVDLALLQEVPEFAQHFHFRHSLSLELVR